MSPYFDTSFFTWFVVLGRRCFDVLLGKEVTMVSDELQVLTFVCFSVVSGFLGSFLVLRRYTMMANALSHTMLFGIVIAYSLSFGLSPESLFASPPSWETLLLGAFLSTSLTIGLIAFFSTSRLIPSDAANGMAFTFLFALALSLLSLFCKNIHIGTELILGHADMLTYEDMISVFRCAVGVLLVGFVLYRGFALSIFDPVFASLGGMYPRMFDRILLFYSGTMIISSFRAVGLVLVLVFFVVPPLMARCITCRLMPLLLLSQGIAAGTSILGVALSRHILTFCALPLSTSALIASLLVVEYALLVIGIRSFRYLSKKETVVT